MNIIPIPRALIDDFNAHPGWWAVQQESSVVELHPDELILFTFADAQPPLLTRCEALYAPGQERTRIPPSDVLSRHENWWIIMYNQLPPTRVTVLEQELMDRDAVKASDLRLPTVTVDAQTVHKLMLDLKSLRRENSALRMVAAKHDPGALIDVTLATLKEIMHETEQMNAVA
jgi:hypothetical protein